VRWRTKATQQQRNTLGRVAPRVQKRICATATPQRRTPWLHAIATMVPSINTTQDNAPAPRAHTNTPQPQPGGAANEPCACLVQARDRDSCCCPQKWVGGRARCDAARARAAGPLLFCEWCCLWHGVNCGACIRGGRGGCAVCVRFFAEHVGGCVRRCARAPPPLVGAAKIRASELRAKGKKELVKQLDELKNELAQVPIPARARASPSSSARCGPSHARAPAAERREGDGRRSRTARQDQGAPRLRTLARRE
jgi:hypothetical protein